MHPESPYRLENYDYPLPAEQIAEHPLAQRDEARLLLYKEGRISHHVFKELSHLLPDDALLVFNETKVVQARLHFQRSTGAMIEIFCLKPLAPYKEISQAMQVKGETTWECMAGNSRRWKEGELLTLQAVGLRLQAELIEKTGREVKVRFSWEPAQLGWNQVLELAGKVPLPPYIHREATDEDKREYQTVFARNEGAVAAPTASLHFTDELINAITSKGVQIEKLTLHVGAGTFQPVEHEDVREHPMHNEQVIYDKSLIEKLANYPGKIVAAGTTSMRALESLYWFGQKLETATDIDAFFVQKLDPYQEEVGKTISREKAMQNILAWMQTRKISQLWGQTEIMIMPGYDFKMCDGLITNFHQPQSTLLMLIAAFIGDDWKKLYQEALSAGYRFLSYGDGSLLWR